MIHWEDLKSFRSELWIWRTTVLVEGIWKVHIFRHLFVCFQTSVHKLGEFHKNRNNSTVFEGLSVSIVDLTVANIRFTSPVKRHLRPSNPQLTPPTLLIQYCYSLINHVPLLLLFIICWCWLSWNDCKVSITMVRNQTHIFVAAICINPNLAIEHPL
jgi:hypothetical protein